MILLLLLSHWSLPSPLVTYVSGSPTFRSPPSSIVVDGDSCCLALTILAYDSLYCYCSSSCWWSWVGCESCHRFYPRLPLSSPWRRGLRVRALGRGGGVWGLRGRKEETRGSPLPLPRMSLSSSWRKGLWAKVRAYRPLLCPSSPWQRGCEGQDDEGEDVWPKMMTIIKEEKRGGEGDRVGWKWRPTSRRHDQYHHLKKKKSSMKFFLKKVLIKNYKK